MGMVWAQETLVIYRRMTRFFPASQSRDLRRLSAALIAAFSTRAVTSSHYANCVTQCA